MKFDVGSPPRGVYGEPPAIGDVYRVQGGRGAGRHLQVIVAFSQGGQCVHLLVLNSDGEIIGATQYGAHVFERRERVGVVPGLADMAMPITWEMI